jgi:glycosyltransferase involved in cell wall biosynthesis
MKILIAHDSADAAGGVETYLAAIVADLAARGHDVRPLHHGRPRHPSTWAAAASSICVESLGLAAAADRVRQWRPDLCFSHNMGPLGIERRLLEWPVVKMMHGYFGTCISGLKMHAFPATRVCDRSFGPACLALYAPRRCGRLSLSAMVKGYRWARDQQALFTRYAAVIVASEHMREEFLQHGVDRTLLHVLPLFSTIPDADAPPGADASFTVLFAGRMTALKGGHVLVAAVARAARLLGRPVSLILAGDGPQRQAWQALARSAGVPAEFTGWIAPERRRAVYSRAALVAVPSLWPEPFGLVGLEAASLGIPAVAFDVGGVRQWLDPNRTGVLVDPASGSEGLGAAIAALLADRSTRVRLGERARLACDGMSRAAHLDRLEAVLFEVALRSHAHS